MKKQYRGYINFVDDGISLSTDKTYSGVFINLTKEIKKDLEQYGSYVVVSYYISDTEKTPDEMLESYLGQLYGVGESEIKYSMGSEWTGQYCTGTILSVGGHDLYNELSDHYDKFLQLDIHYSENKNNYE